jgi:hypothetical protein
MIRISKSVIIYTSVLAIAILLPLSAIYYAINHEMYKSRVYYSCIDDGKKEYECYGMVYGGRVVTGN